MYSVLHLSSVTGFFVSHAGLLPGLLEFLRAGMVPLVL